MADVEAQLTAGAQSPVASADGARAAIRAAYQCTFDDYVEAIGGARKASSTGAKPRSASRGVAGWALFLGLAVVLFYLLQQGVGAPRPPANVAMPTTAIAEVAPLPPTGWTGVLRLIRAGALSWVALAFVFFFMIRAVTRPAIKPWEPPASAAPSAGKKIVGWTIAIATILFLSLCLLQAKDGVRAEAWSQAAPGLYDFALGTIPLVLAISGVMASISIARRTGHRRQWEAQPSLGRPYTLEATDVGLSLDEPLSRQEQRWDYYAGFRETEGLLLIYHSAYGVSIIPKRAFADLNDLDRFKGLLVTHVKHGTLLPVTSAFPVAPIPAIVIPIEEGSVAGARGT